MGSTLDDQDPFGSSQDSFGSSEDSLGSGGGLRWGDLGPAGRLHDEQNPLGSTLDDQDPFGSSQDSFGSSEDSLGSSQDSFRSPQDE